MKTVICPESPGCSQVGCSHWSKHDYSENCKELERGNILNGCKLECTEVKMKTLEAMEKFLKGKRYTVTSIHTRRLTLTRFAEYCPEYPEKPAIINEWLASQKVADNSARAYLSQLQAMGEYMEVNYDLPNPFKKVEKINVEKKQRRYLTPQEEMLVLSACHYSYDRELILTLASSLCRIGELAYDPRDSQHNPGLKGKDVGDNCITVKGKTGEHKYRCHPTVCQALRKLAGTPDDYVFIDEKGQPAAQRSLAGRVHRVFVRSGIGGEKLGAHTLRHSGASLVAKFTKSPLAVQEMLRHDDIKSSMGYIHDAEDEISEGIEVLDLLAEANGKQYQNQPLQLEALENGEMPTDLTITQTERHEAVNDLSDDLFPPVEDDISVRPLLKTDDLRLLRNIFIAFYRNGGNHQEMIRARELMKRMFRKVGANGR